MPTYEDFYKSTWNRVNPKGYSAYTDERKEFDSVSAELETKLDDMIAYIQDDTVFYTSEQKDILLQELEFKKQVNRERRELVSDRLRKIANAVGRTQDLTWGAGEIRSTGLSGPSAKIFSYYESIIDKVHSELLLMYFGNNSGV